MRGRVNRVLNVLLPLIAWTLVLASGPVSAAWWEFGRTENEPVITELKFNQLDVVRQDDRLVMSLDELVSGAITVRGRAEVIRGAIGLVEISLDGGRTWRRATMGDRGLFTFEFRPEVNRDYDFVARAVTTTGRSTDLEDHRFVLRVRPMRTVDEARQVFFNLLEIYSRENRTAFMELVSADFEGVITAVEEAIVSDFRLLDNIRIQPNITRVMEQGGKVEISFTFNRQVQSARTGRILRDTAASSAIFKREGESFKLLRLAAPLIFGVSFPEDVATTVTTQSVGTPVLQVSATTGTVSTAPQQSTVRATSTQTGSITLISNFASPTGSFEGFDFDDNSKNAENYPPLMTSDIGYNTFVLAMKSGVRVLAMSGTLDSITEAPASGYTTTYVSSTQLAPGKVFAFELPGPKYAVVEITAVSVTSPGIGSMSFRFKYQPSGSRSL